MKYVSLLIMLLGLAGTALHAASTTDGDAEFVPLSTAELELAAPAWDRYCAKCHGEDGNGPASRLGERLGLTINYAEPGALDEFTDEKLVAITADGIDGTKMRGFAKKLSAEEIAALVRYMRSMSIP